MEKVSVIMPCFNDGVYIMEAVESVLKQTYKNIELIIIDDGSDDPVTLKTLANLKNKEVTLLKTNRLRPAGARNHGIEHASGKYILPLDADDKISETYIEKAVNILENDIMTGVVYCQAELFGEKTGKWDLPEYSFKQMLLYNMVFVTALFRKEDWEMIGGFCTDLKDGMEDYDFWLSILELGKTIYQIPEVLFYYRIKSNSRTKEFMSEASKVQETYAQIYGRHRSFFETNGTRLLLLLRKLLILGRTIKIKLRFTRQQEQFLKLEKIIKKSVRFFIGK